MGREFVVLHWREVSVFSRIQRGVNHFEFCSSSGFVGAGVAGVDVGVRRSEAYIKKRADVLAIFGDGSDTGASGRFSRTLTKVLFLNLGYYAVLKNSTNLRNI